MIQNPQGKGRITMKNIVEMYRATFPDGRLAQRKDNKPVKDIGTLTPTYKDD